MVDEKALMGQMVKALAAVPERSFRIAELAPSLLDEKGKVDLAKCMDNQGEINLAIAEVSSYINGVKELRRVLENAGERQ